MTSLLDDEDGGGIFDDYPDVDKHGCQLLGPTALVVQGLMGVLVILSLIYKRHRESSKRPWRIWWFDISKQVIGQLFVHGVNVLISGIVAHVSSGNACVLYFLNILIDTTLGVAIIYLILHLATYSLTEKCHLKGFESGKYGSPPSLKYWARQAAVYVFALTTMKLLVVALFALWPGIFKMGEWLLSFLGPSEAAQVIFTMGLFPILMNIVQFWLIDSIVKANVQSASVALPSDTPRNSLGEDREPLFHATSDDEDEDDDDHRRPHDIENPPPRSRSRSQGDDKPSPSPENKSSGVSSVTASGSVTPSVKDSELGSQAIALHAYPPSRSGSPESSASASSSRPSSASSGGKRRRRSPPPPLSLHPRSPLPPAVNGTPVPSDSASVAPVNPGRDKREEDEKEWAAWDDDPAGDWAERVHEEDWTGKRMEAKKDFVQDAWAARGESAGQVRTRS